MRKLIVGLLLAAALLAYLAIDVLEIRGRSSEYQTFFWMLVGAIELPILVMLALQVPADSPRALAATAAIALVEFAGLLPFFAFILFLSAMDFMNDGLRWGPLLALVGVIFAVSLICRRQYRHEPPAGWRNAWSGTAAINAAYVILAYVALYSYVAEKTVR